MGEEGVDLNGEAEQGITARTDFNAREGLLIVWLEGPEPEAEES